MNRAEDRSEELRTILRDVLRKLESQDRLIARQREEIERLRRIVYGRYAPPLPTEDGKPQVTVIGGTDADTALS